MPMDPELLRQLLAVFTVQLDEQIQLITDRLLTLEKGIEGEARAEELKDIMRAAHNIKGAARGVGIHRTGDIAHHLETLFNACQDGRVEVSAEVVDLSLAALDEMREATRAYEEDRPFSSGAEDILSLLDDAAAGKAFSGEIFVEKPEPNEAVVDREGKAASSIKDEEPRATPPGLLRIAVEKLDRTAATVEELQVTRIKMNDHMAAMQVLCEAIEEFAKPSSESTRPSPRYDGLAGTGGKHRRSLADSELLQPAAQLRREMRDTTRSLELISSALHEDMRLLRLVPVSTLLQPLVRSVRDIARELGKRVNLEIQGGDVEMDGAVLERLRDPLMHLLRNAIDHGIELPEARQACGKAEEGCIGLRVRKIGTQIEIRVTDDGLGIDAERVQATAHKKKLLPETHLQGLGKDEIIDLIFHSGFSTNKIITDISGRGLGLDVVRANIKALNGNIHVDTVQGRSTTFVLRVPLTLTTEHGLLVEVATEEFLIPISAVERVLTLDSEDIVDVEGGQAIVFQGRPVSLRHLADALGMESVAQETIDGITAMVVTTGWRTVALVVDAVLGERQLVIKPLKPPLVKVRNVSGGSLTGSGTVLMVLNPEDLVESALSPGPRARIHATSDTEDAALPRVLVVDDSLTTRTLEKNILENHGYEVVVAVNSEQGWDTLQRQHFDLVISDVEMPGMDGFEFTALIKQTPKFADLPVIIVTSVGSDAHKQQGIDAGADAYIVKSQFETRALIEVVRQLV